MTDDLDPFKVFLDVQLALPRNGPGSAASTARALAMLPGLPEAPRILDIGCGQGASTFDLLQLTKGHVTAVDLYEPFLENMSARAERERWSEDRLTMKRGDMAALPFHDGEFDLVWSEGAIYLLGFARGLKLWRRFVKPGGYMAVTECTWLTDEPSAETKAFWGAAYPGMGTAAENCAAAERAGYEVVGTFTLPPEDWWREYYTPMRARIATMRATYGAAAKEVLDEVEAEIGLFERNPGQYSYVFYVLRRLD
ncbi:MAG: methyltransferase domain-containing protein [Parvibaculum sp.]|uniref:class I SAM-dependent methyltransferase n=1 Tax=Parvibaculum sp. TaxID=2024848 RepID=UPI00271D1B1B|nr:methyltransferase domain-containing protein [Parvibaculum sp.]MDO8838720.1 methyltransferase domain-containing protein [Parvibaculum sp.]